MEFTESEVAAAAHRSRNKEGGAFLSKSAVISFLVLLQIISFGVISYLYFDIFIIIYSIFLFINFILALRICVSNKSGPSKVSWIILIMWLPVFGSIIYIVWGERSVTYRTERKLKKIFQKSSCYVQDNPQIDNTRINADITYLKNCTYSNAFFDSSVKYLAPGETAFEAIYEETAKAEKFILIEFFIMSDGMLFERFFELLSKKYAEGVEVMIIYDDMGSKSTLSNKSVARMQKAGFKVHSFNKFVPLLNFFMSYRDHRKFVIVDGKVAFTGGINLADEYINRKERFGVWKDNAVMVTGEAVRSMIVMFLNMFELLSKAEIDYNAYLCSVEKIESKELVHPFGDNPVHKSSPSHGLYSNIISRAKNYVYIQTPYLIIDDTLINALRNSALSGVDVRILMPGIPDKKLVFAVSRSYYRPLLSAGVKIYEFTPGFVHSKVFLSDDECAVVGSINMDYRSFNLQYESAVYMAYTPAIIDIRADFDSLFAQSKFVTVDNMKKQNVIKRALLALLRLFSPLM